LSTEDVGPASFGARDLQLKPGYPMGSENFIAIFEIVDDPGPLAIAQVDEAVHELALQKLIHQLVGFFIGGFALIAQGEDFLNEGFGALAHELWVF
jgi:hypothetical protein